MQFLALENVTKRFGGIIALKELSFSFNEGEILGIIGPNGAGKTTIFNLLSGFYCPDEGRILFKGESLNGCKPHEICKRGISRTFQIVQPIPNMSVIENVMVGGFCRNSNVDKCYQEARDILDEIGLLSKKERIADKLTLPDRKRLELGRALATKPTVVLLDEIMAGLMPAEWEKIIEVILRVRKSGVSIMLIEHVMKAITKISDRIIVINEGLKVTEGKPYEVTADQRVIKAYLGDGEQYGSIGN